MQYTNFFALLCICPACYTKRHQRPIIEQGCRADIYHPYYSTNRTNAKAPGKDIMAMIKYIKSILATLKQLRRLHKFSRDIIHGSFQFTAVLYAFAGIIYMVAPSTPDYIKSVSYYQAALEIAPVILAGGIVAALLSDLVLRKIKPDEKPSDQDKKDR